MTPRVQARRLLPGWQRRLRLGDWQVAVSDLEPEADSRSNVDYDVTLRRAVIRLLGNTPPSQIERQLVHELLHVRFALATWAWDQTRVHTPPAFDGPNKAMWNVGMEAGIEAVVDALGCAPRAEWGAESPEFISAFPVSP